MKQAVDEKTVETASLPTNIIEEAVQDRIAALPEGLRERAEALKKIEGQLGAGMKLVRDELDLVLNQSLEKNMNPDERVIAEIADRFDLSSSFGVGSKDFDTAINEIKANETTLTQLRRLGKTGAEMTITSVTDGEIVLMDTVDNVNVEAQEIFLSKLLQQERADAISNLQQRFPAIEQLLKRADNERGLHYYDYLLICETTGAEPMSEEEYRALQERKPVDRQKLCWLLTEPEMLGRGDALLGGRDVRGVYVGEDDADGRGYFRAGRPLLRVQRA